LAFVVADESLAAQNLRARNVQDVERARSERGRVGLAQVDGALERETPEQVG
jgi:hypothetical protein